MPWGLQVAVLVVGGVSLHPPRSPRFWEAGRCAVGEGWAGRAVLLRSPARLGDCELPFRASTIGWSK